MERNMSFAIGNFQGTGKPSGVPVFLHQLPATRGGIIGAVVVGSEPKFGRLVSADPDSPNTFVVGLPSGNFAAGILMFDPAIAQNDPAMNDLYFEGRPATVITCGPVQLEGYERGLADGRLGMTVWANRVTGEIGFEAIGTTPDAGTYVQLNAHVYEKNDPNGTTIWLNQPVVSPAASEARPSTATPVAKPGAGAVATGTAVALSCATEGATIYYTTDASTPDATDTKYTAPIAVTVGVTIKAIAYVEGHAPSTVLSAVYTIAP